MTLKNLLNQNEYGAKLFGEKGVKIILKQLQGIAMSQPEKNRLSEIRKKLRFIAELSKYSDEFDLKKNSENLSIIKKSVALLLEERDDILAILLYGSHVDKSAIPRSDLDIVVILKKDIPMQEATKLRIKLLGELPEKVDLQIFNLLPQKIKRDIARSHRILYKSKEFDNLSFSVKYLKDEDYFIRKRCLGL
jgi:predicted nucleotidyltransferase